VGGPPFQLAGTFPLGRQVLLDGWPAQHTART